VSAFRRFALPTLAAVALAGCTLAPTGSYVAGIGSHSDALVTGSAVAAFVAYRLPPGGAVALAPTFGERATDAVTPILTAELRQRGVAVVDGPQPPPGVHHVRYWVTSLDSGELVRVTLDGSTEGARFFARNTAGTLQAGGPYTMTQAETAQETAP